MAHLKNKYNPQYEYSLDCKEERLRIAQLIAADMNLHIGDWIVRKNEAGVSYNKIIGFTAFWDKHSTTIHLRIICDRAKRYAKEYGVCQQLTFYHGEIWDSEEVEYWRSRGWLIEGQQAREEFENIWKDATNIHNTCFLDE